METDLRRQKLDLVWASVIPGVFAMWGLTMLITNGGEGVELMALLMAVTLLLSVCTGSILLLCGGQGRGLLLAGRVLVCLQLLCLVAILAAFVLLVVTGN